MNVNFFYRSDLEKHLEESGLNKDAIGLIVKATSPLRHKMRTEAVKDACLEWHDDGKEFENAGIGVLTAAILDCCGTGGILGTGKKGSTKRHPAFQGLGTGRKYARDGGAWTAAIENIIWEKMGDIGNMSLSSGTGEGGDPTVFLHYEEEKMDIGPATSDAEDKEWWMSLARRGILVSSGIGDFYAQKVHQAVYFQCSWEENEQAEDANKWAEFLAWLGENKSPAMKS